MDGLTAVLVAFVLCIQLLILKYVYDLETIGCECATNDWRRDYIMSYLAVTIVLGVINVFLLITEGKKALVVPPSILVIFGWIYIITTLQYVDRLRREKCECSKSVYRDIMELFAMINALMLVFALVLAFVLGAVTLSIGSRNKK